MTYEEKITINPEKRFGRPCIAGTRIAISDILGWLANGMSFQNILEDFPELKEEDIRFALIYASQREHRTMLAG